MRQRLEGLGLTTWVKTSGRTGLHLYLRIVRELDFDAEGDPWDGILDAKTTWATSSGRRRRLSKTRRATRWAARLGVLL